MNRSSSSRIGKLDDDILIFSAGKVLKGLVVSARYYCQVIYDIVMFAT